MYKNSSKNKGATALLSNQVNHFKSSIKSAAKDVRKNVKRGSIKLQGKVAHEIGHKPFKAVGIAMLSGMVLSMMMQRRAHRRFWG